MVVKKRQDRYDFNGFHVLSVPRAPRSARGRSVRDGKRAKFNDSEICAIELLASLAGKLLQESESCSASSNASFGAKEAKNGSAFGEVVIKPEIDESLPLKTVLFDQEICVENVASHELVPTQVKQSAKAESDSVVESSSVKSNSDTLVVETDLEHIVYECKIVPEHLPGTVEVGSDSGASSGFCSSISKDSVEFSGQLPALVNVDNDVDDLACPMQRNNAKSVNMNGDDENFKRNIKIRSKTFRTAPRIGNRRVRKLLQSKYWIAAPKFKDSGLSKAVLDGAMKLPYRKRKACYSHEGCHCIALNKRRMFSDYSLVVTSNGGFSRERVCNSPEKGFTGDNNGIGTTAMFGGVNGVSSLVEGHESSLPSKDSLVKFSVKSFRIPELFVEVPENATVGSLKRTVMEAAGAMLGRGLHVGLLLHGKKVRDDNITLSQTGITSCDNLDTLGFSLEPDSVLALSPSCTEELPAPSPLSMTELVSRSPATPDIVSPTSNALPEQSPLTTTCNNIVVKHKSVSPNTDTDTLADRTHSHSRALVLVPPASAESLAVVPVNQKSRRSELVQRRTRRPFSVLEVEALVKAVEDLGTGRWRDIKFQCFENADHRTYVDLKDKWKTLVHTAKIAPQQRRGEPVPQELLDRVLVAEARWSQHQAKQHSKNILKITDTKVTRMESIPLM